MTDFIEICGIISSLELIALFDSYLVADNSSFGLRINEFTDDQLFLQYRIL